MANEEVTIQFEGYEDDTATYVVVTNISGEIDEDGPLVETEQIDIQPVYEEDLIIETIDPICNDTNIELVTSSSGSRTRERGKGKRKYDDKEVEEWSIELPIGIMEGIREPLRPYRVQKPTKGDIETTKSGVRRRHDGKRWHRLCCVEDCDRVCKKMGKCITHYNEQEATVRLVE